MLKQIAQNKEAGCDSRMFDQTYAILCGLSDFFYGQDRFCLFDKPEFWEILQEGLVSLESLTRKRTMYLLKRALDVLDKWPSDLLVMSDRGNNIFFWSSDHRESLISTWQDYILFMETLDEKQVS